MPTIELKNVSKIYKNKNERIWSRRRKNYALRDVDLTINQGEFVFVVGSSGSGKSTLLKIMAASVKPNRGNAYLDERDMKYYRGWGKKKLPYIFGQVWQYPTLLRKKTIEENLKLALLEGNKNKHLPRKQFYERIDKVLGLVGMYGVNGRYPVELTYGETRRVELARALINSPQILILDEITNNLDDDSIWDMFQLLDEINKKGTTVIMATHASRYVNIMHKRVLTLVDGRIFGDVKKGKYGDVKKGKYGNVGIT